MMLRSCLGSRVKDNTDHGMIKVREDEITGGVVKVIEVYMKSHQKLWV